MAWITVPNQTIWEYDDAPSDPGGAESILWNKQTNGIRINTDGMEIYTKCRIIGINIETMGELNKTYWDAQ